MLTFSLDEVEEACPPGIEQARSRFKPGRRYTLKQVVKAGLSREGVAWLLIDAARRDRDALRNLRAWVAGMGGQPKPTVDACMAEVQRTRIERVQALRADGMDRGQAKTAVRDDDFAALIKAFS